MENINLSQLADEIIVSGFLGLILFCVITALSDLISWCSRKIRDKKKKKENLQDDSWKIKN